MNNAIKTFYYKNNRLQQLRGFCYAAQFGNISRAAKHMGLTRSSVSLQIKALEEDLKIKLFRRNGPHIILTYEGKKLLDLALPCVSSIQDLPEKFDQELEATQKVELRIALNSTTKNYIMPPIINAYLAADPNCIVTLHHAEHTDAMKLLEDEEVDCAVLPRRDHLPFPKDCRYIPVFFYTPSLITRRDHPLAGRTNLSIEEICGYNLTLPPPELRVVPNLYDIFSGANPDKKLRINFTNAETGREYIEAGHVITIGSPCYLKENDVLVATPLPYLFPEVDYGFVLKDDESTCEKTKKLINIARKHVLASKSVEMRGIYLINLFLSGLKF